MKAQDPTTKQWRYFIDKCLPFSASVSCAIFQRFSNALHHLVKFYTGVTVINCLDDFLFMGVNKKDCNRLVWKFLWICKCVNFPVALDKTQWASDSLTFLGILMSGRTLILSIPLEKRLRAQDLIDKFLDKCKATVREIQQLCGYLNFLNRAIFPGRAFTQRMYSKFAHVINK